MKNKIAFALIMGVVTTCIISLTLIMVNIGYANPNFFKIWLRSWGIAYLVVTPAILIIGPQNQKFVDHILKEKKG